MGAPGDEKKLPTILISSKNYVHDPEAVQEKLKWVDGRLQEVELDGYGKRRGIEPMLKLLRAEASSQRQRAKINTSVAQMELKRLIYLRHALRQGAIRFKELDTKTIAKSFLGEDTKQNIAQPDARIILVELWRLGKSQLLDNKYKTKHLKQQENKRFTEERQREKQKQA